MGHHYHQICVLGGFCWLEGYLVEVGVQALSSMSYHPSCMNITPIQTVKKLPYRNKITNIATNGTMKHLLQINVLQWFRNPASKMVIGNIPKKHKNEHSKGPNNRSFLKKRKGYESPDAFWLIHHLQCFKRKTGKDINTTSKLVVLQKPV